MKIINLTEHVLRIMTSNGKIISIPPSGNVARVETEKKYVGKVMGIELYHRPFGAVNGLPKPQKDVIYIVSTIVVQALRGARDDVYAPDELIRNGSGEIVACKGLAR